MNIKKNVALKKSAWYSFISLLPTWLGLSPRFCLPNIIEDLLKLGEGAEREIQYLFLADPYPSMRGLNVAEG